MTDAYEYTLIFTFEDGKYTKFVNLVGAPETHTLETVRKDVEADEPLRGDKAAWEFLYLAGDPVSKAEEATTTLDKVCEPVQGDGTNALRAEVSVRVPSMTPEPDMTDAYEYTLIFTFDDGKYTKFVTLVGARETHTLETVRKDVEADEPLRTDKAAWEFLYLAGDPVSKAEEATTTLDKVCKPVKVESRETDTIALKADVSVRVRSFATGTARYRVTFQFGEEAPIIRNFELDVPPDKATLAVIRGGAEKAKALRRDDKKWLFQYDSGGNVLDDDEKTQVLTTVSTVNESLEGGKPTFTATVTTTLAKASVGAAAKPVLDVKLIAAIKSGTAEPIPDSLPEPPKSTPIDPKLKVENINDLTEMDRFHLARTQAFLFQGLNLKYLKEEVDALENLTKDSGETLGPTPLERYVPGGQDWVVKQKPSDLVATLPPPAGRFA